MKKILNKPSFEQLRQNIEGGKQKKMRKLDMETVRDFLKLYRPHYY